MVLHGATHAPVAQSLEPPQLAVDAVAQVAGESDNTIHMLRKFTGLP